MEDTDDGYKWGSMDKGTKGGPLEFPLHFVVNLEHFLFFKSLKMYKESLEKSNITGKKGKIMKKCDQSLAEKLERHAPIALKIHRTPRSP